VIARSIAVQCLMCGATFETTREGRGRYPRFCSPECRAARKAKHVRRYAAEGRYPVRRGTRRLRQKICAVCGEAFATIKARTQCCGTECGSILARASRSANARGRRLRRCESCGSEFLARSPSGRARRGETREGRFCSRRCAAAARRSWRAEP